MRLPCIVDEANTITVNYILPLPGMAAGKRKRWKKIVLALLAILTLFLAAGFYSARPIPKTNTAAIPDSALLQLSEQFLYKIKLGEPIEVLETELASLDYASLQMGLNNDNAIKTFWLNIYNGWFQVLAVREKLKRPYIFTAEKIIIASKKLSLDDIEHGILRKFRWKYSKGYLPAFFPGRVIKQLAVEKIDYRIHFALNCGARSCPPIAFYKYDAIDSQLDLAAKSFLRSETEFDNEKKIVQVTKIMDWFIADFGGRKGIRNIIRNVLQKDVSGYSIKFKHYNWDEVLHNFNE
jgi:hypothetical protein